MNIRVNLKTIRVEKIKPNPWNPNKQSDFIFDKERKSIRDHGFIDPILVRGKGPGFEVIDGEHRLRAAMAEGYKEVPCNDLGKVSDAVAKQLTIIMNETRGKADPTLLQTLLKDLESEIGVKDLIEAMPFQQVEIESLLANSKVDWDNIGPSLTAAPPTIVGSDNPIPQPEASTPNKPKTKDGPPTKIIQIEVSEDLYKDFFEQVDKINKVLEPKKAAEDCSPVAAIQAIVGLLRQTDLKAALVKVPTVLRKSEKSKKK